MLQKNSSAIVSVIRIDEMQHHSACARVINYEANKMHYLIINLSNKDLLNAAFGNTMLTVLMAK
jgi:hypothetical protein